MKQLVVHTADDWPISAHLFEPKGKVLGGIIINSATAVPQGYYAAFAQYLSEQGFMVITYDYRGVGGSRAEEHPQQYKLSISAWGEKDLPAVLDWASNHYPDLNWHCIGHSVGGQLIGLAHNSHLLKSAWCVASQSGYWRYWQGRYKVKMWLTWYCIIPLSCALLGKMPGWLLGGESLNKRIAQQWASWGRHPNYILSHFVDTSTNTFAELKIPMHFSAIEDDLALAPVRAVKAMSQCYTNANVSMNILRASEFNMASIGHFGFFKRKHRDSLWGLPLDWINGQN